MRKPEVIEYKNHKILYLNFENLRRPNHIKSLEEFAMDYINQQKINSVLVLTNVSNMFFNNEIRNHFIKISIANSPYIKASAIYGLQGISKYMFNDFINKTGRNIQAFKSRKEGLQYLISFDE